MSKQINFFMSLNTQTNLLNKISSKNEIILIKRKFSTELPEVFEIIDLQKILKNEYTIYICRMIDFSSIITKYYKTHDGWLIDIDRSPVIEFSASRLLDNFHTRGRFYVIDKYFSPDGRIIEKSQEFKKWVQYVFGVFRRHLKYDESSFDYYDSDVKRWIEMSEAKLGAGGMRWEINIRGTS